MYAFLEYFSTLKGNCEIYKKQPLIMGNEMRKKENMVYFSKYGFFLMDISLFI